MIKDSTLNRLWSRAVKAKYGRCPVTGQTDGLEAHHVVLKGRNNRYALRWDIRNGVPLHATAHRALHDGDLTVLKTVLEHIKDRGDTDYLMSLKNVMKPDFLKELGLTDAEFREAKKKELQGLIDAY